MTSSGSTASGRPLQLTDIRCSSPTCVGPADQHQPLPRLEIREVVLERSDPDLRSRKVLEDRDLATDFVGRGADAFGVLGVDLAVPVGEVQPRDVHPRLDHPHERVRIAGGGADRGDDLRAAHG